MRLIRIISPFSLFLCSITTAGLPITQFAPTTAPAQSAVLLVPFHAIESGGSHQWISQALDESLANDLARNTSVRLIHPATQPSQPINGLDLARQSNADLVVTGSYQVVDDQLRITTDVLGVRDVKSIGEFKTTGKVHDLFNLEDTLAAQLAHALPADANAANNDTRNDTADYSVSAVPSSPPPTDNQNFEPANTASAYDSSAYPNYYGPGYSDTVPAYTYGDYGYPYYYPDYPYFFFSAGFNRRGFEHGRNFDHGRGFYGSRNFNGGFDRGRGLNLGSNRFSNGGSNYIYVAPHASQSVQPPSTHVTFPGAAGGFYGGGFRGGAFGGGSGWGMRGGGGHR